MSCISMAAATAARPLRRADRSVADDRPTDDVTAPPPADTPVWMRRSLRDLLAEHDLAAAAELPFPNDGWSGSRLTALEDRGRRFVLKRTSFAADWIVRSTRDSMIREAVLAAGPDPFRPPLRFTHLGAAAVEPGVAAEGAAILMPDLSESLLSWDQGTGGGAAIPHDELDRVLAAVAEIHAQPWSQHVPDNWPWCPAAERVTLLTRPSAERYAAQGVWVGGRFIEGWDAFDRVAPPAARELVATLSGDAGPLVEALAALPATGLHGDLKLANVALHDNGEASFIDWQMASLGPVALELGWFLVANVAQLPDGPDRMLDRYLGALRAAGGSHVVGDWEAQRDLVLIMGLLLRGWRKGLDAEADLTLPTGASAVDDLTWWCASAVEAAARRL